MTDTVMATLLRKIVAVGSAAMLVATLAAISVVKAEHRDHTQAAAGPGNGGGSAQGTTGGGEISTGSGNSSLSGGAAASGGDTGSGSGAAGTTGGTTGGARAGGR